MNCQVPHVPWTPKLSQRDDHFNRRKVNEDRFAPDSRLACPLIGFNPNGSLEVIAPDGANCQPLLMDLAEHHTLPIPLLTPTFVKCGNDPDNRNIKPIEHKRKLAEAVLAHECHLLITNNKGLTLNSIKSTWDKFSKGQELPTKMKSLETIMDRYGCEKLPKESFVGGNLATLKLNDERYLIHSVDSNPLEWDATLCLTRMAAKDMKNHPMDTCLKLPLDGGTFYQISVPSRRFNLKKAFEPIFATRQFNTTRVWKVEQTETDKGSRPIITNIHENCNLNSALRCVDLNPYIWGEVCELRSDEVTLSQDGFFHYRKNLDNEYDCCAYMDHPKTLVLSCRKQVVFLDTRCEEILKPLFSLSNQDLSTYYNMNQNENIVSFSASPRDYISFMCTETSLLVWDIRKENLPLSKTAHLMDNPPSWIASVEVGSDKDWVFLDSRSASSSGIIGLSWGSQCLSLEGSSVLAPSIEIEPRKRWTAIDTLEHFQRKGLGIEWCTQNRFKQMRSGLACDKENDGTIQLWQCTIAGDVFSQQLDVNGRIGPNQQKVSQTFVSWLPEWMNAVRKIEEESPTSNPIDSTELFKGDIEIQKIREDANLVKEYIAPFYDPKFVVPDNLEQPSPFNYTQTDEWRDLGFVRDWETEDNAVNQYFPSEETFANDFEDDLISSTPLQPKSKAGPFSMSTPASRPKHKHFPTSKPFITSTPNVQSGSSISQPQKASTKRKWDDF